MELAKTVSLALVGAKVAGEAAAVVGGLGRAGTRKYELDPQNLPQRAEDAAATDLAPLPAARSLAARVQEGGVEEARALLQDFRKRSQVATSLTNCVTEQLEKTSDEALEALASLDGEARGRLRLCGVPISVKECFEVVGTDSTAGLSRYKGRPSTVDSVLVQALRAAGGIPFCKTNVSQLMLSWECSNPLYGTTTHPLHRHFIPGGSSGGEACLIAQEGSVIGLGTDVGGSCRIPGALSGCIGIKPTKHRLSGKGQSKTKDTGCWDGQQLVASCPGVMARTVDDALLFFESVLSEEILAMTSKLDCHQVPLTWDSAAATAEGPLRIGYFEEDGFVPVSPAVRRAVRETAEGLRKRGHDLVPFQPPDVHEAWKVFVGLVQSGFKLQVEELGGDKYSDFIARAVQLNSLPKWLTKTVGYFLRSRQPVTLLATDVIGEKTTTSYYSLAAEAQRYKAKFQKTMDDAGVDLLLCPCQPLPTQPRCSTKDFPAAVNYTAMYNLLDYAAGALPVTELRADDIWAPAPMRDAKLESAMRRAYESALATGVPFPVAVQAVARPYREELLMRGLREIELATGGPFANRRPRTPPLLSGDSSDESSSQSHSASCWCGGTGGLSTEQEGLLR